MRFEGHRFLYKFIFIHYRFGGMFTSHWKQRLMEQSSRAPPDSVKVLGRFDRVEGASMLGATLCLDTCLGR